MTSTLVPWAGRSDNSQLNWQESHGLTCQRLIRLLKSRDSLC